MKQNDRKAWLEKTQRVNENIILEVGFEVKDLFGRVGVVKEIIQWDGELTEENHGTVAVENEKGVEHYPFFEWQKILRVIDKEPAFNNQKKLKL